jgi:hypothetical protein
VIYTVKQKMGGFQNFFQERGFEHKRVWVDSAEASEDATGNVSTPGGFDEGGPEFRAGVAEDPTPY